MAKWQIIRMGIAREVLDVHYLLSELNINPSLDVGYHPNTTRQYYLRTVFNPGANYFQLYLYNKY